MQTITALVGIPRLIPEIIGLAIIALAPGLVAAPPAGGKRAPAEHRSVGPNETRLQITVRVYNYARLSPDTLKITEQDAEVIFKPAGIGMAWVDCPLHLEQQADFPACQAKYGPNDLLLSILPTAMEPHVRLTKEVFGFATSCAPEGSACLASVFSERARRWALETQTRFSYVLSRIIAHELGHLLLPGAPHSHYGLMRAIWGPEDLDAHDPHPLLFTPEEGRQIRARVASRAARNGCASRLSGG
jgi:hypothetical protein